VKERLLNLLLIRPLARDKLAISPPIDTVSVIESCIMEMARDAGWKDLLTIALLPGGPVVIPMLTMHYSQPKHPYLLTLR
jgi:hypothetical protein